MTQLKKIREKKNISQGELALKVGLSQAEVSRKESGVTSMDVKQLEIFAKALGVPVTELLEEYDDQAPTGTDG